MWVHVSQRKSVGVGGGGLVYRPLGYNEAEAPSQLYYPSSVVPGEPKCKNVLDILIFPWPSAAGVNLNLIFWSIDLIAWKKNMAVKGVSDWTLVVAYDTSYHPPTMKASSPLTPCIRWPQQVTRCGGVKSHSSFTLPTLTHVTTHMTKWIRDPEDHFHWGLDTWLLSFFSFFLRNEGASWVIEI